MPTSAAKLSYSAPMLKRQLSPFSYNKNLSFLCLAGERRQASGSQRAGRAGRVRAGKCWRLYPEAFHQSYMPTHTLAEMLRTPLEELVLQVGETNSGSGGGVMLSAQEHVKILRCVSLLCPWWSFLSWARMTARTPVVVTANLTPVERRAILCCPIRPPPFFFMIPGAITTNNKKWSTSSSVVCGGVLPRVAPPPFSFERPCHVTPFPRRRCP